MLKHYPKLKKLFGKNGKNLQTKAFEKELINVISKSLIKNISKNIDNFIQIKK